MRKLRLGSFREFQLIGDGAGSGTCSAHIGSIFFLQDPFSCPLRVLVAYVGGEEDGKGREGGLKRGGKTGMSLLRTEKTVDTLSIESMLR